MSPSAGAQLIADALDLRHRLPLLWKRVSSVGGAGLAGPPRRPPDPPPPVGRCPVWVDEQLADRSSCGPVVVDRLVAQAIAAFDPEDHEDREDQSRAGWDVTLTHPEATDFLGTSHLEATGDTLTLKTFYDQVCAIAHQLFLDGDTDPSAPARSRPSASSPANPQLPAKSKVKVYARVEARDLEPRRPSPPARSRSSAPPPSPRSATGSATTRSSSNPSSTWPAATPSTPTTHPAGCATSSISATNTASSPDARSTPVLRPRPHHPLRRERTTRPNPTRATSPALCRRHHRAKTTGRWRYLRTPDGDYLWHGPYGATYLVSTARHRQPAPHMTPPIRVTH